MLKQETDLSCLSEISSLFHGLRPQHPVYLL